MFKREAEVFVIGENFLICCCCKDANIVESPFCIGVDTNNIKEECYSKFNET